jgi:putative ABC transport system substrate-binding protein
MMSEPLQRREFITLLGGGAVAAWPVAATAQRPSRIARIGYLVSSPQGEAQTRTAAFREALEKLGWTDGRNIRIDYRWGVTGPDRARAAAAELVSLVPDVILAQGSTISEALRLETRTIPIVFVSVTDPLGSGLVDSLAHPGRNLTGFVNYEFSMGGKWLQLLKDIAPGMERVLSIVTPDRNIGSQGLLRTVEAAAPVLGLQLVVMSMDAPEIERAVSAFADAPNGGLLVLPGAAVGRGNLIVELAKQHRLPALYTFRPFIASGGLMSYDTDQTDLFRRAASYVDRILRGAKPGDLPVQFPTKFEMVLNLKTAKALGLTVPDLMLVRADEVIE